MTNLVFREASASLEKYGRDAFLPHAGQRSRAILPGDDPGDQQPPERRGFDPDPHTVATNATLPKLNSAGGRADQCPGSGGPQRATGKRINIVLGDRPNPLFPGFKRW